MKGLNTPLQRTILAVLNVNIFVMAFGIALLNKLYSIKTVEIGILESELSWLFNVFTLSVSLMCLFFGKLISPIGSEFTLKLGLLIMAGSFVLNGILLDLVNDPIITFVTSLVLQMFAGIGKAAFNISYTCIICREFKGAVVFVFAVVEICFGLGNIAGKSVGELLYGLGGYYLPLVAVCGSMLVACVLLNHLALPRQDADETLMPLVAESRPPSWHCLDALSLCFRL